MLWSFIFFFFNDTATTEIYTLSLHDALPISTHASVPAKTSAHSSLVRPANAAVNRRRSSGQGRVGDRKSTRLNSSHLVISYAVFCLKTKINGSAERPMQCLNKRVDIGTAA